MVFEVCGYKTYKWYAATLIKSKFGSAILIITQYEGKVVIIDRQVLIWAGRNNISILIGITLGDDLIQWFLKDWHLKSKSFFFFFWNDI